MIPMKVNPAPIVTASEIANAIINDRLRGIGHRIRSGGSAAGCASVRSVARGRRAGSPLEWA
jgi:hypothetical protein